MSRHRPTLLYVALAYLLLHLPPHRGFASEPTVVRAKLKPVSKEERKVLLEEFLKNESHSEEDVLQWLSEMEPSSSTKWHREAMKRSSPRLALRICQQMVAVTSSAASRDEGRAVAWAFGACNDAAELRKLLALLEEKPFFWKNSQVAASALQAANVTGEVSLAAQILDRMESNGLKPTAEHFQKAIAASARRQPPSPGVANYFMQEMMRKDRVDAETAADLLLAHRETPLSSTMSFLRSMMITAKRSSKFGRTQSATSQITPEAAVVMASSLLGKDPAEIKLPELQALPTKHRTALKSLLEDLQMAMKLPECLQRIEGLL